MTAALISLKNLPPSEGPIIDPRTLNQESLKRLQAETETNDDRLEQAIARLVRPALAYHSPVSWEAGYALTTALAGKEITENDAKNGVESMLALLNVPSALKRRCRHTPEQLWRDPDFQWSLTKYYQDVRILGATEENARIAAGNLSESAEKAMHTGSILCAIPPAELPRPDNRN
jgi:hypothetical protein